MSLYIDRPYAVHRAGTATTCYLDHLRDMVEEVVFTARGERVNRPDFGVGLGRYVFEGFGADDARSLENLVLAELTRWLGEVIAVSGVRVTVHDDGRLLVDIGWAPILRAAGPQATRLPRR